MPARPSSTRAHGPQSTGLNRHYGVELEVARGASATGQAVTPYKIAAALTTAGVVCEYRGYTHALSDCWKIVTDASVHDGFEIVSPILQGNEGFETIRKVCAVLKAYEMRVNSSCGLHVHLNAANMTARQFGLLYKRYAQHEAKVDAMMAESRRENRNSFCGSIKRFMNSTALTASNIAIVASVAGSNRHYKINAASYARHKTIEFRQHQGTLDPEKIINWVRFLLEFSTVTLAMASVPLPPIAAAHPAGPEPSTSFTRSDLLSRVRFGTKTYKLVQVLMDAPERGYTRRELVELTGFERVQQVSLALITLKARGFGIVERQEGTKKFSRIIPSPGVPVMPLIPTPEALREQARAALALPPDDKLFQGVSPDVRAYYKGRAAHFTTLGVLADEAL